MGFIDTASAVMLGNFGILIFGWACLQFHKHDYKAPWTAYAAFLIPLFYVVASALTIEGLPPQFDALAIH